VNTRDKNFTRAKMARRRAQIEASVARYLQQLDTADRQEPSEALATKIAGLRDKIAKLGEEMRRLADLEARMLATPDQQISLTDPAARSMATSGRGSGVVGYNGQAAVDLEPHLIVAHDVTHVGTDVSQLAAMAQLTKAALKTERLEVPLRAAQKGGTGLRAGRRIVQCLLEGTPDDPSAALPRGVRLRGKAADGRRPRDHLQRRRRKPVVQRIGSADAHQLSLQGHRVPRIGRARRRRVRGARGHRRDPVASARDAVADVVPVGSRARVQLGTAQPGRQPG
jgi:hypothetical protein